MTPAEEMETMMLAHRREAAKNGQRDNVYLTKREHFAAMAMQAFIHPGAAISDDTRALIASTSVAMAHALLLALEASR